MFKRESFFVVHFLSSAKENEPKERCFVLFLFISCLQLQESNQRKAVLFFLCYFPVFSYRKVTKGKPPRERVSFGKKRTCRGDFLCSFLVFSDKKRTKETPPRERVSFEEKRTCRFPSHFNILSLWKPSPVCRGQTTKFIQRASLTFAQGKDTDLLRKYALDKRGFWCICRIKQ